MGFLCGCTQKTHRVFFGYVPGCLNPGKAESTTDRDHCPSYPANILSQSRLIRQHYLSCLPQHRQHNTDTVTTCRGDCLRTGKQPLYKINELQTSLSQVSSFNWKPLYTNTDPNHNSNPNSIPHPHRNPNLSTITWWFWAKNHWVPLLGGRYTVEFRPSSNSTWQLTIVNPHNRPPRSTQPSIPLG